MGRHQIRFRDYLDNPAPRHDGPRWSDPYFREWAKVVGMRIRRLRRDRDWTLIQLAAVIPKPEGGRYSAGYFSRIERGWCSATFYTYLAVAAEFGVEPGRLLGADDFERPLSGGESALLDFLDRAQIAPEEAIVQLAQRMAISELSPTTKR